MFGLISGGDGLRLSGDPPTGILEDIKFDPGTGRLSFRSKLSVGKTGYGNWTQDVYEFDGVLSAKKLKGDLITSDELCPDKCREKRKIVLKRSALHTESMDTYKTYAEWKVMADRILKRLGPRW